MIPTTRTCTRRQFLRTGFWSSILLSGAVERQEHGAVIKAERDPYRGLKVGITSYVLRKFPLDGALAMTRSAGLRYISLKDAHLSLQSTAAQRRAAHQQVQAAGLTLLGGGVIYLNNRRDEIRAAFEYAREAGMPTMICSPDPAAMDLVEAAAREYRIRVAIHNHGPGDQRYPSPLDVLRMVRERDPLLGICLDVGHTVRLGEDSIEVIRQCASRLYDFHIKDVTEATPKGEATEVGKGVIDIVGVLRALVRMEFTHHVALEYEAHPETPMPGVMESIAYIRGVLAALD